MSAALKVVRAGLFDTVQDLGRIGYMELGMPTAGAMDRVALTLANALVGNPANTAGLEIGVMGPDLLVEADSVRIALVGSLSPSLVEAPDAAPKPIDSDLGESFGPWVMGNDTEVLKIVKSANVACGFHASDPVVMVDTVKLCKQNGVSIGAHPGFADLQGFGRRVINLSVKELEANIAYQLGALQAIAALQGLKVTHIKPHGMMGNMSAESAEMSEAIARATKAIDRDIIFLAQANTEQGKAAEKVGLRAAEEVFADRTYQDNGFLTPRKEAGSMIKDPAQAVAHVRRMVDEQAIYSTSGKRIPCRVDSICVHGDGPTAVTVSRAVREGLEAAGIRIVTLPELPSLKH